MTTGHSTVGGWWSRAAIFAVAVTILCVPSLVNATRRVTGPAPLLRLNRGFDAPQPKQQIDPPVEPVRTHTALAPAPSIVPTPRIEDDAIPVLVRFAPPDPQRGPPLV